ncbi:hypothetical protein U9M48_035451 [Paspalum notatum var. saurae]|uniref:Uncharacterized protein n=1 Tax=Paspalum notatum var. saurae TaxID=547442 RepID=A0AAQ3X7T1_PASNO
MAASPHHARPPLPLPIPAPPHRQKAAGFRSIVCTSASAACLYRLAAVDVGVLRCGRWHLPLGVAADGRSTLWWCWLFLHNSVGSRLCFSPGQILLLSPLRPSARAFGKLRRAAVPGLCSWSAYILLAQIFLAAADLQSERQGSISETE